MGCAQSKIENEEAVTRCKERKQLMKEAVIARNAFAAAHSAYAMALKNTGAALSDYSHGEFLVSSSSSVAVITSSSSLPTASPPPLPVSAAIPDSETTTTGIPQPGTDTTLFPPPPLPPLPLQRAATMPEMNGRSGGPIVNGLNGIEEDGTLDDDDDEDSELENRLVRKSRSNRNRKIIHDDDQETSAPPPPPANSRPIPSQQRQVQQPQPQQPYFDYFFPNVEHMPGTTLEDTPQLAQAKPLPPQPTSPSSEEEDDEEEDEEEEEEVETPVRAPVEEKPKRVEEVVSGMKKSKGVVIGGSERSRGRFPVTAANLANVFNEIDNDFLKASESAHEVSKMLEATRLHYHSNFADNRGIFDFDNYLSESK